MKVALISTYELGHQPFGLASPAAWLEQRRHEVVCLDLSRVALEEGAVREARLIGFYVPMHTAARITLELASPLRRMNPDAHFCVFGLYAGLNEPVFRKAGIQSVLGAEFEEDLAQLADELAKGVNRFDGTTAKENRSAQAIPRLNFEVPDRRGLPELNNYAHVVLPTGEHRTAGYTEASRGCKHLCRHCPIVPVYQGTFRVVQREIVLEDIRRQVTAGARHITFGDPDFFNGVTHAMRIVRDAHEEFPALTYDATIKIEHLKKHKQYLAKMRETGCLFITSAVESLDDQVLLKLDKGHTHADFLEVLQECRNAGLTLQPTFVPFTPWTTEESYINLLDAIRELDLIESVAPIQLGIRLLISAGSRLLELPEIHEICGAFDEKTLVHPWKHVDARMDALAEKVQEIAAEGEQSKLSRSEIFGRIWEAAQRMFCIEGARARMPILKDRATVPYLNEPWYC